MDGGHAPVGLMALPRELRDLILGLLLTGSPLFITQWTCSRSAVTNLQHLKTRIASMEHETSASASLDFFAQSALLHVNRQLRREAVDILRTVGYRVYVVSHTSQINPMMTTSDSVLRGIDAICLTNACRCAADSKVEDLSDNYDGKYELQRDKVLMKMPNLQHLYLRATTTLVGIDPGMMGLYVAFLDVLKTKQLQSIYVECGTASGNNYAADRDYESSWVLGPPRGRQNMARFSVEMLMQEVYRRRKLRSWLAVDSREEYVDSRWPLPRKNAYSLRFILERREDRGLTSGVAP